jgi:hypothetical protein
LLIREPNNYRRSSMDPDRGACRIHPASLGFNLLLVTSTELRISLLMEGVQYLIRLLFVVVVVVVHTHAVDCVVTVAGVKKGDLRRRRRRCRRVSAARRRAYVRRGVVSSRGRSVQRQTSLTARHIKVQGWPPPQALGSCRSACHCPAHLRGGARGLANTECER